ncbi:Protein ZBED8 [Eumeta japonica]|uniref:Protein ZBED8 n=1 Tax=Eumeta variegata TaxID=151549 RepID=A0A4C1U5C1_EUMVA|nr:Protein ZBED8 [Eumeta japonica]
MKPAKLPEHLKTVHPGNVSDSDDDFRTKRARFEKAGTLTKLEFTPTQKLCLKVSYKVAYRITQQKKPYIIAETLVKPCALDIVELRCGKDETKKALSLRKCYLCLIGWWVPLIAAHRLEDDLLPLLPHFPRPPPVSSTPILNVWCRVSSNDPMVVGLKLNFYRQRSRWPHCNPYDEYHRMRLTQKPRYIGGYHIDPDTKPLPEANY